MNNTEQTSGDSSWWLLTVNVLRDDEETASTLLFDLGSTGLVTLEERLETVTLGAYFDQTNSAVDLTKAIEAAVTRIGLRDSLSIISIAALPDQDWMQKWKEGFEATKIGRRLIVAPSWKLPARSDGRIVIQIDPGMAFGTGTHETTRLCLEAIEKHWHGVSLLDVGTGTGILAIAAALLEPESRVLGIDVDPKAIEVAHENLVINRAAGAVELSAVPPGDLGEQEFDVIVANLTAEVINDLLGDLTSHLASGGLMILSGILCEQTEDVERALVSSGFIVSERNVAGEWCSLVASRSSVS
jgi:ribosomal protein L11 methyltransferase